jgi:hypothetical protein
MNTRRRTLTYLLSAIAAALVLAAAASARPRRVPPAPPLVAVATPAPAPVQAPAPAPPPPPAPVAQPAQQPPPAAPPTVEVVFALDTTGSMSGLIDGAKRKIWSLVDFITSAQPQPRVRVGLVAYRDRGDAYVTRFYDLSSDMDAVFERLSSFRAEGGGDTPEHVARALHDAIERTSWSEGQSVARLVYLVGDAPPHTDYDDGYDFRAISRVAAKKGIHLNAILCGADPEAERAFRAVARLGGGRFAAIEQSGGVAAVVTPYDRKLAELDERLSSTVVVARGRRAAWEAKAAALHAAPAGVVADRASFAAKSKKASFGDDDLIDSYASAGHGTGGGPAPAALPASELPPELARLSEGERSRVLAGKAAERAKVMEEIRRVAADRERYIRDASGAGARNEGFDAKVRSALVDETKDLLRY